MGYLVFAQTEDTAVPVDRLAAHARAHFGGTLSPASGTPGSSSYASHGESGDFRVSARLVTPEDITAARETERHRPSGGLADLAARCRTVWTIETGEETPEWLLLEFSGLLASVALGPILTPDGTRLLGVRSARERADELRGGPRLMR